MKPFSTTDALAPPFGGPVGRHRGPGARPGWTLPGAAPLTVDAAHELALRSCDELVVRHSSGTLAAIVREHLDGGGKRLRSRLALECAASIGLDPRAAVPVAVACELLHNATLIHDDLQDGDAVRRGRPTVWSLHGSAQAINAGDLLLILPTLALLELSTSSTRAQLCAVLARRAAATACGQADELSMLERGALEWSAYSAAAVGKTGQILAIPFESAAVLAGLDAETARLVGDLAARLGLAYQIADDVLDLYGDKGRGAVGNDLREGKVSALVALHLERVPADREALVAVLRAPRDAIDAETIATWAGRFEASGARADAVARARGACASIRLPEAARALEPMVRGLAGKFLAGV